MRALLRRVTTNVPWVFSMIDAQSLPAALDLNAHLEVGTRHQCGNRFRTPVSSSHGRRLTMGTMRLSKREFFTGTQCPRKLWLQRKRPSERENTPAELDRMEVGRRLESLAQSLYTDGVA